MIQLGMAFRGAVSKMRGSINHRLQLSGACNRQFSVKPDEPQFYVIDPLSLVKALEGQGIPSKHADAITYAMLSALEESLVTISQKFISKTDMHEIEMAHESKLSKFKYEVQSSENLHLSTLQNELKKLQNDMEKTRRELSYEMEKVTAAQRMDWNLEKRHIRDTLATRSTETTNLINQLDREIQALRVGVTAAKYDLIKYCFGGTILSVVVFGVCIGGALMG